MKVSVDTIDIWEELNDSSHISIVLKAHIKLKYYLFMGVNFRQNDQDLPKCCSPQNENAAINARCSVKQISANPFTLCSDI